MVFSIACLIISYFQNNSENERFKYAYYWLYNHQKKDGKQFMFDIYKDFSNDSIFELKKQETKLNFDNETGSKTNK
jgi:hypothetical protein